MNAEPHTPASTPDRAPSGNGQPGRDCKGRFTAGNTLCRGNPFARRVAALRTTMLERVTPEAMGDITDALIARARVGELAAIKLLFDYVVGKPVEQPNPDRLDIDEWKLLRDGMLKEGEQETMKQGSSLKLVLPVVKAELDQREVAELTLADEVVRRTDAESAQREEVLREAIRFTQAKEEAQGPPRRPVEEVFRECWESLAQPEPPAQEAPAAPPPNGKRERPSVDPQHAAPSANGPGGWLQVPETRWEGVLSACEGLLDLLIDVQVEAEPSPHGDGGGRHSRRVSVLAGQNEHLLRE